ncbi:NAD-dependent epimerase/dehydratase family protein [Elioraea sp. Yellowstone]|jgi:UDP-glucose 4-epimerase|uniref:NAD-dependent epimerase/dehydratase family protein n=1 Tax=Elioraea sp. Yellowstone TaxID=2592070 RepID=UPI0011505A11|nr:NAD-dependent epimerase/dehydratase family protein [Elioraea sp. Yellowstone]TQF78148.1 NAD-dependent epimerase/dehydratase family protein [Elioraea sp. Yellowstone]
MPLLLVTGGCGFIGSHLCAALIARGDAVRVLDDLSTGSRANLAPGAELVVGDVADPATVRAAMAGVEGVFHLAAIASVQRCTEDWLGAHRVNLSGSIAVFDAARNPGGRGPVPVVYASSAAVYGEQDRLPIAEDAPCRPLSAYGADKLGSELHARVAGSVHGVPTLGLRFFNVFGPRQDPRSPYSGVISIFCDRFAAGEGVEIYGDGAQTRDFIAVSDVVAGLVAGLGAASTTAPVLNLCTGRATSVVDLARTIAGLCGIAPAIRHGPARPGEIRHSVGAPERARAMLGLGAPRTLAEGLGEVLAWLRAGRPGLAEG